MRFRDSLLLGAATSCLALLGGLAACSSSSDSGASSGAGGSVTSSTGGSSAGGASGAQCAPAGADGSSACGNQICDANEHCDKGLFCQPGCLTSANCEPGMGCDLSGSTTGVGVCNKVGCGAGGSGGASGMNCPTVSGAYTLSLDVAKSSTQCKSAFSGNNACSISQTGCKVSWACSGAGFSDVTIDSDGKGTTTVPTPGGTANCNVRFYPGPQQSLSFDCSLSVSGQVVVCSGTGH